MHNPTAADVHPMMVIPTTQSGQVGAGSRFLLESELSPPEFGLS
jgi:hypothetical protein